MAHEDLWNVYAGAIIECEVDGRTRRLNGAHAEALPAQPPIFVLTAYNPQGRERSPAANVAAEAELERELTDAGLTTFWPALGHSRDASWLEAGVAIAGLDRGAACEIGDRYEQLAVYEIVAEELRVVRCTNGEMVRARPRVE